MHFKDSPDSDPNTIVVHLYDFFNHTVKITDEERFILFALDKLADVRRKYFFYGHIESDTPLYKKIVNNHKLVFEAGTRDEAAVLDMITEMITDGTFTWLCSFIQKLIYDNYQDLVLNFYRNSGSQPEIGYCPIDAEYFHISYEELLDKLFKFQRTPDGFDFIQIDELVGIATYMINKEKLRKLIEDGVMNISDAKIRLSRLS